jgi:hypothetical protein
MTIDNRLCLLGLCLLLSACGEGAGGAAETPTPAQGGVGSLPHLVRNGRSLPYFRYGDASPESGLGRAFFLYPVLERRNELVAFDYNPRSTAPLEQLFGEELLGASGPVVVENNFLRIQFLPISLPLGLAGGEQWRIRYARRQFACLSRAVTGEGSVSGRFAISCTSPDYTLSFVFDRERGVTEYQDFCDASVCTFRLIDQQGLLSRASLEHMGLPPI